MAARQAATAAAGAEGVPQDYLQTLLSGVQSPAGMVGFASGLGVAIFVSGIRRVRWPANTTRPASGFQGASNQAGRGRSLRRPFL